MSQTRRPTVVVAEPIGALTLERLRRVADVIELPDAAPDRLIESMKEADALLIRARAHVTARVIDAAPRLRVIGRAGPSLDHIDMRAAARRQITVVYTPMAHVTSIAEYTVGLMLASARRVFWYDRKIRVGEFETLRVPHGREITNLEIGILGGGIVAEEVARILRDGFRARLIGFSPPEVEAAPKSATAVDLDGLLRRADVLSIHMPAGEKFTGLVGAAQFALMKPTACIVNTSRGSVVDNRALADALKTRRLGGAALDVFDAEPLPGEHPLRNAPNCILSPHVAAATLDVAECPSAVVEDIIRVLGGEAPLFPAPMK